MAKATRRMAKRFGEILRRCMSILPVALVSHSVWDGKPMDTGPEFLAPGSVYHYFAREAKIKGKDNGAKMSGGK